MWFGFVYFAIYLKETENIMTRWPGWLRTFTDIMSSVAHIHAAQIVFEVPLNAVKLFRVPKREVWNEKKNRVGTMQYNEKR